MNQIKVPPLFEPGAFSARERGTIIRRSAREEPRVLIMVSALVRTAVRRPAAAAAASARRAMSGDAAHAAEEMAKWKKMTAGMGALSVATTAIVLATEEHHHPDPDAPVPSYMKIRSKPHPWNCADCSLLDSACFAKCKEERA